ncbi:DUF982 domain-containing protein [Mesorhizobium sp. M1182]
MAKGGARLYDAISGKVSPQQARDAFEEAAKEEGMIFPE